MNFAVSAIGASARAIIRFLTQSRHGQDVALRCTGGRFAAAALSYGHMGIPFEGYGDATCLQCSTKSGDCQDNLRRFVK